MASRQVLSPKNDTQPVDGNFLGRDDARKYRKPDNDAFNA